MTIAQINQGNNEFSTIYSAMFNCKQASITARADDSCAVAVYFAVYLHSKNPYLHSISCMLCNKYIHPFIDIQYLHVPPERGATSPLPDPSASGSGWRNTGGSPPSPPGHTHTHTPRVNSGYEG